ncbi:DUF116 domain-containing protein [Candidatus Micrarchaeota archaeon]|nr:DUF116 domain-containing protein [Candidatus Micrarchaeota archaeon]
MDFFNFWDVSKIIGATIIIGFLLILVLSVISLFLLSRFHKKGKIIFPYVILSMVSTLEVPIERILNFFQIKEIDLDLIITKLRNKLNKKAFSKVPLNERAIFFPQCLRSFECPARTGEEGIYCINCRKCGLGHIIKEAEQLGYRVFIAPGSSLVKRMVKQYKPKAVLGVGCSMEVKEGTALIESYGIPVQAVSLLRGGCVNTRIDCFELLKTIYLGVDISEKELRKKAEEANKFWKD